MQLAELDPIAGNGMASASLAVSLPVRQLWMELLDAVEGVPSEGAFSTVNAEQQSRENWYQDICQRSCCSCNPVTRHYCHCTLTCSNETNI